MQISLSLTRNRKLPTRRKRKKAEHDGRYGWKESKSALRESERHSPCHALSGYRGSSGFQVQLDRIILCAGLVGGPNPSLGLNSMVAFTKFD